MIGAAKQRTPRALPILYFMISTEGLAPGHQDLVLPHHILQD